MPERTTRMKRGGALPRRGRARFRSYVPDKAYQRWVRGQGCVIAGKHECKGVIQFCHIKTRGSSGQDAANGFPGCVSAHDEQGHSTLSFEAKYGIDLRRVAQELWDTYQGEQ